MLRTLSKGRKTALRQFFQVLGYLFLDWSAFKKCEVRDYPVSIYEVEHSEHYFQNGVPSNIPSTLVIRDEPNEEKGNSTNVERYKSFCQERIDLRLIIEHDVYVRTTTRKTSLKPHRGDERRRWRRSVSFLDVAANYIRGMCGFDSTEYVLDVLSFHKKSITALYHVAKIMKKVILNRHERSVIRSRQVSEDNDVESKASNTEEEAELLDSLFKHF